MGRVGFKFGRWLGTVCCRSTSSPRRRGACSGADQRADFGGPAALCADAHRVDQLAPRPLHLGVGQRRLPRRVTAARVDVPHEQVGAGRGYRLRRIDGIPRASVDQRDPMRRSAAPGCARQVRRRPAKPPVRVTVTAIATS